MHLWPLTKKIYAFMPHFLWHRALVFAFSIKGPSQFSCLLRQGEGNEESTYSHPELITMGKYDDSILSRIKVLNTERQWSELTYLLICIKLYINEDNIANPFIKNFRYHERVNQNQC